MVCCLELIATAYLVFLSTTRAYTYPPPDSCPGGRMVLSRNVLQTTHLMSKWRFTFYHALSCNPFGTLTTVWCFQCPILTHVAATHLFIHRNQVRQEPSSSTGPPDNISQSHPRLHKDLYHGRVLTKLYPTSATHHRWRAYTN